MKDLTPEKKEIALMKPFEKIGFWEEVDNLFKNIERRAYELFEWRGREDGHELCDWFRAEKELLMPVNFDITERDNIVTIKADVPGFEQKDLEVNLEGNTITIKGEKKLKGEKKEEGKVLYRETEERNVFRTMTLPFAILPEKATAELKNGVLEIKAPRALPAKTLEIKAA